MKEKEKSQLADQTTQSLLTEIERCFKGTFAFLLFLIVATGGFQIQISLSRTIVIIGVLLFVLQFSLRFFKILRELKERNK